MDAFLKRSLHERERLLIATLGAMIAVAVLFGLWFVRYSKALWLALDLTLSPPNSEDFEPRGRV